MKKGVKGAKWGRELQLDAVELGNKQSVRTTFKLRERTINLLKVSAKHLGIKQKTLLDQLLEDKKTLGILAEGAATYSRDENECRPKTFVLSKKALDTLEDVSNRCEVPRNFIAELSVSRLASYIDSLAETHQKRRSLLKEFDRCKGQFDHLSEKAGAMLLAEDAFLIKVKSLTTRMKRQVDEIRKTVKDKNEFIY